MASGIQNNLVSLDDRQTINCFAGASAQFIELKEELTAKQMELENLSCAEDEIAMCNDDTDTIPYLIGDVLLDMNVEDVKTELERARKIYQAEISDIVHKLGGCKQTFIELKAALYARFGSNVDLDIDNNM